jgi:hypothetical protein
MFRQLVLAGLAAGAVGVVALRTAGAVQEPPVGQVSSASVKTLSVTDFERLHRFVQPKAERWAEIPWQTDLMEARRKAAAEKKPILMWIMDGHPLGCT